MKVITEAVLRQELRASEPETYYIPDGKILSPAAREYLQQRKIKIAKETQAAAAETPSPVCREDPAAAREPLAKFVDYETGAFFTEKPALTSFVTLSTTARYAEWYGLSHAMKGL